MNPTLPIILASARDFQASLWTQEEHFKRHSRR